jgi:phosphoribosyl-ATP pyrophosphohydrolase
MEKVMTDRIAELRVAVADAEKTFQARQALEFSASTLATDLAAALEREAKLLAALEESRVCALALEQELRDRQHKMSESEFDCLILDAMAEALKAMRKFPQPNYVISKIAEEAGEVVKAAIHCAEGRETAENVRGEMKQLIAMLYRLWVEGDQVHGLLPVRPDARTPRAALGAQP